MNIKDITPGEWDIHANLEIHPILDEDGLEIIAEIPTDCPFSETTKKANAELIADAGTTANKCGMLFSEVLEQRDELVAVLEYVRDVLTQESPENWEMEIARMNHVINRSIRYLP